MLLQPVSVRTLRLAAGEHRVLRVDAGSRWLVLRGELCWSDAPRWLGERLVCATHALPEGAEHRCEHPGWITLQARTASTLVCETPMPIGDRLRAAWRIIRGSAVAHGSPALGSAEP
jgi:hypothetical protein